MLTRWKVLAPVDCSSKTEERTQYAALIATALFADLHWLHVLEPGVSTAAAITSHADMIGAEMLLMTSRVLGKWSHLWRPSVTQQVTRKSRVPVCVASASNLDLDYRLRSKRFLCVVGLDGKDAALIDHAEHIADRTGADLVLLHVVPEPSEALLHLALHPGQSPLSRDRAVEKLAELSQKLQIPAITSAMVGDPAKCIASAAREHSADLVIISGAGSGTLHRVLPRVHCPVVTVPVDYRVQRSEDSRGNASRTVNHAITFANAGSYADPPR